jgi:hypothetical protein
VTEFAVGFNIAGDVVVMIAIQMIQVQTILKPDPSITGNRANPSKLTINILTKSLLVLDDSRTCDAFFAGRSTGGTFRLEGPILPFTNQNVPIASSIQTLGKFVPFSEELRFHLLREVGHQVFL